MPKSVAERVKAYLVRKRQYARAVGLCYTCRKRKPDPGRVICKSCNAAVAERKRRKRKKDREAIHVHYALSTHERAGDTALEHHFHDGAVEQYRDALRYTTAPDDRTRLSEKLARTLFLSGNPKEASRWLDDALSHCMNDPQQQRKLAELLLERARQSWLKKNDAKGALADITQAVAVTEAIGDSKLYKLGNLRMIGLLRNLGRFEEAQDIFNALGVDEDDPARLRCLFFSIRALMATRAGKTPEACENYEQALKITRETGDVLWTSLMWYDYGRSLKCLGDTSLAKTNLERALLVARQSKITWCISHTCLEYADLLTRMGYCDLARHYLQEAFSYDVSSLAVKCHYAEVGVRLALEMKDVALLAKCTEPRLLRNAFQSQSPGIVGPVAASFALFYAAQGEAEQAQDVLHRALAIVTNVDESWDLCIEVARQGKTDDIARARSLLEARTLLPNNRVACAYMDLFNAFVAQRAQHWDHTHAYAAQAAEQFEQLQWHFYAALACTLLPKHAIREKRAERVHVPFAEMQPVLTERERQVAELVLKGLTNRAIAENLAIKETTVESHMSSILGRLGMRSRHQLVDAFSDMPA